MKARYPDLAESKFAWGGSFGTQKGGGGVSDLMHFDIMRRRDGVRANHFPQIQDLGPMPVEKRTLANYLGHNQAKHGASLRRSFGHPNMGHHPATIGREKSSVQVINNAGSGVVLVPH